MSWPLLLLVAVLGFDPRPLSPRWASRLPALLAGPAGPSVRDPELDRLAGELAGLQDRGQAHRFLRAMGAWEGLLVPVWADSPADPSVRSALEATLRAQARAGGVTHFGMLESVEGVVVVAVRRRLQGVTTHRLGGGALVEATPDPELREPEAWLGLPEGGVRRLSVSAVAGTWQLRVAFDAGPGVYTVEALAGTALGREVVMLREITSGTAATTGAAPAPVRRAGQEVDAHLAWLNDLRKHRGLRALAPDPALGATASAHAEAMARVGLLAHLLPGGRPPLERIQAGGVRSRRVFENIALGEQLEAAEQRLWESPSHRRALLDPALRRAGVGYRESSGGTVFLVEHLAQ